VIHKDGEQETLMIPDNQGDGFTKGYRDAHALPPQETLRCA
jgi:hypothetical protein